MPFKPGDRGNPSGRPKKTEEQIKFERQCREWAALFAVDRLKKLANSDNPTASLAATKEMCDRGFGKSVETSIVDAYVAPQTGSTAQELADGLAEIIGGPKNGGGGSSGPASVDTRA